jgi:hypothetical protein
MFKITSPLSKSLKLRLANVTADKYVAIMWLVDYFHSDRMPGRTDSNKNDKTVYAPRK